MNGTCWISTVPLHLSDDWHLSLYPYMHVYSFETLKLPKLPPSSVLSGWLVLGVAWPRARLVSLRNLHRLCLA